MGCTVIGCGKALPSLSVDNDAFSKIVETSDEWISRRTGIHRRRIACEESNVDLAEVASRAALGWDDGGYTVRSISAEEIDLVIYSSVTPDAIVPSDAALLRRRLGLVNAVCFDINAACSGFVYAVSIAEAMLASSSASVPGAQRRNRYRRALVVGSERVSRITNWTDRSTCILLGDGAGAAILEWNDNAPGILATYLSHEDDPDNALTCAMSFDSRQPSIPGEPGLERDCDPSLAHIDAELGIEEAVAAGRPRQLLFMNGQRVFKFSTRAMGRAIKEVCARAGVSVDDIACIVPHQANERIIKFAAKRSGIPFERFQLSIADRGNASSACTPMALADTYENGRISPGDKVILVAFGGGLTYGAVLFEA